MPTKDELREIVRKGDFDWHGYDYENVVSSACEHGAGFLDEILCGIEAKGGDVNRLAWEIDDDGYTAMYLYAAKRPAVMYVFRQHGVDTTREIKRYAPYPSSNSYDWYMQSMDHELLEKLGRELLGERMRPDGASRRIDHAANVVALLKSWGIVAGSDGDYSAAAWCLGILDDISDPVTREETEKRIHGSFNNPFGRAGDRAMNALRLLAFDGTKFRSVAEQIRHIAESANSFELAMAIADRLCLVREWLARQDGLSSARTSFSASLPLFERKPPETMVFPNPFAECIPAEIAAVRGALNGFDERLAKPAMPSTPQVLVEKPAIPWIALEEVPKPANHGLAAFWAFAKSLWKKAPAGPNRGRPPSST